MGWSPERMRRIETPAATIFEPAGRESCDFCLKGDPEWAYPAVDHDVPHSAMIDRSEGAYAACDVCKDLIEASKIGALVERAVHAHKAQEGLTWKAPPLPVARRNMRENVLRFMDARTGPPRPNR